MAGGDPKLAEQQSILAEYVYVLPPLSLGLLLSTCYLLALHSNEFPANNQVGTSIRIMVPQCRNCTSQTVEESNR